MKNQITLNQVKTAILVPAETVDVLTINYITAFDDGETKQVRCSFVDGAGNLSSKTKTVPIPCNQTKAQDRQSIKDALGL